MAEPGGRETERLLDAAFRIWSERGAGEDLLGRIARSAKVDAKRILYWYDDLETLCRLATDARIKALRAPLQAWRPPPGTARDAIRAYAGQCVDLLASDDYRRLCYVVVRDGALYPWLARKHDDMLLGAIEAGLARIVREATERSGVRFEIRASGARGFVARLQRELALPMLLPGRKAPTRLQGRILAAQAADEAMRSLYPAGMILEGLAHAMRA